MNIVTPDEIAVIQMGLQTVIEDIDAGLKNPMFPFTPETRKEMKDMLACCRSALLKVQAVSGRTLQMDPYKPGDETEFLTKES